MSSIEPSQGRTVDARRQPELLKIVHDIGHLLPVQGPLDVFVHHNTLHAFEHLSFEEAVVAAGQIFGCESYLPEDRYRSEMQRGRILESEIREALRDDLGEAADAPFLDQLSLMEFRHRVLVWGVPERLGSALRWILEETDVLRRFRTDLPLEIRRAAGKGDTESVSADEVRQVRALWRACLEVIERIPERTAERAPRPPRPHHALLAHLDIDVDEWVHPILIRITSAFLDQGVATRELPRRERGLYRCFLDTYRHFLTRLYSPLGKELQRLVRTEYEKGVDSWDSLATSLEDLGLGKSKWGSFLRAEALALRGFAGMVHQFEQRPDRIPNYLVPTSLVDFLAVRLLISRAALSHAMKILRYRGGLADFRGWLAERAPKGTTRSTEERAWPLFQVAQLAGLSPERVRRLSPTEILGIGVELCEFDGVARRRIFHDAYERHLRVRFFDALAQHVPVAAPKEPVYQAIFCIDDREESMRRHLEEVNREVETFGVAGFFGVAMYYQSATEVRARPLCPVNVHPRHFIAEVRTDSSTRFVGRALRRLARIGAHIERKIHVGKRHVGLGAVLFLSVGMLWVLPLILGAVFPSLLRRVTRFYERHQAAGRLELEHTSSKRPPLGEQFGFSLDEMAAIVHSQLVPIGIRGRFSPLVVVLGHGSAGLNNPHRSAYDCGACGGGHGGPNARAFAQMANDARVRARLVEMGMTIPEETWFVGGERNTTTNEITLSDQELAPPSAEWLVRRARRDLDEARRRESLERSRRFDNAPLGLGKALALQHVRERAYDLAQPRPECGHATNAVCFVGRRERTRNLFLDRRAFLVSYDPLGDAEATQLAKLLAAVVPVVAGINLEYFFSYVDRSGYGAGTKLPHNITALVGVMDGTQSDFRTGLPWQMVELHEPVRLSIVVEARPAVLRRLLAEDGDLKNLVDKRWVYLAALDPHSGNIVELNSSSEQLFVPRHPLAIKSGDSLHYFRGQRGNLPFVTLEPRAEEVA